MGVLMASKDLPILIAGGGIGGLSVALALALKGRRARVLEKAPEFGEIGYGIQMGPNVSRMLDRLGLLKALEPHSVFPDALILVDAVDNRELTRIALGRRFLERYQYRYFVIHRRDLHGEILEACRRRDEITLEASRGLASFEERGNSVFVRCENGAEYEGAALVGADGLWSPTRAAIVGDAAPRVAGHVTYRGVVPTEEIIDRGHLDSMTIWIGPDLHLVQYRLAGDRRGDEQCRDGLQPPLPARRAQGLRRMGRAGGSVCARGSQGARHAALLRARPELGPA